MASFRMNLAESIRCQSHAPPPHPPNLCTLRGELSCALLILFGSRNDATGGYDMSIMPNAQHFDTTQDRLGSTAIQAPHAFVPNTNDWPGLAT